MRIPKPSTLLLLAAVILTRMPSCESTPASDQATLEGTLTIFHAGSLAVPFEHMIAAFHRAYPQVEVQREIAGSRTAIRKVTELGKLADVIASADYRAIEQLMFPEFADWYICFATNQMVIAYTDHSLYQDQIDRSNWYEILTRDGVEYGHSDPDADPCGYRTLLVWQLAERHYQVPGLYHKLVAGCPSRNMRPKETDLIALLQAGALDYAFVYRSLAQQHGLRFLELPPQIDLSDPGYREFYAAARIEISGIEPGTAQTQVGEPIVYALTIPKNAPRADLGLAFVEFVLSPEGQAVMGRHGQSPIVPAYANDRQKVPPRLKSLIE
ncbi:MAG TPA: tungstate ABC transporter substrate-binding protein WtpA [Dehalococcoidia bacterium]|nr:tungstate ABC transporter substrate-binding protein WtpA [Dehalococcoidia bacterium]